MLLLLTFSEGGMTGGPIIARGLLTNESVSVRNEVGTWPTLAGSFEAGLFIIYPLRWNLQVIIIIIVVDIPR